MTCWNILLCHDDFAADGAVLALGLAAFGAGGRNSSIRDLGMTRGGNGNMFFFKAVTLINMYATVLAVGGRIETHVIPDMVAHKRFAFPFFFLTATLIIRNEFGGRAGCQCRHNETLGEQRQCQKRAQKYHKLLSGHISFLLYICCEHKMETIIQIYYMTKKYRLVKCFISRAKTEQT